MIWHCAAAEHGRPKVRRSLLPRLKATRSPIFSLSAIVSDIRMLLHYSKTLYTLTMLHLSARDKRIFIGMGRIVLQPLALMIS